MKVKLFVILILIFSLLLTACSKKKIEEKIFEKIVEEVSGGEVDIDTSKDTTTITTSEGSSQIGSDLKWPKDKMDPLPEIKANIVGIFEDKQNKSYTVTFDSLKLQDAKDYVLKLKDLGYTEGWESESANSLTFAGYREDMTETMFIYREDGGGTIILIRESTAAASAFQNMDTSEPEAEDEEIDLTDAVPWPSDFIEEVPELEGKITGISTSGNSKYISMEYVEKNDVTNYIEEIKSLGFTVDSYESVTGNYISYYGYNENGDYINISWDEAGYTYVDLEKSE